MALTGRVRHLDQVAKATDLLPAAREVILKDGIRGFECVPIRARHRILGTLSLGRRNPDPFSEEEVALLESTADQIGLALDNARLYGETRQQLEDLRHAQTEVVKAERLAAVGELAGGVAHEINNPLMIILGQVHLLFQSQNSDEILNGLRVIDGATKRAAEIIRDLILFAEHFPLRPTRCRVAEEIGHVLDLHRGQLDAHRVDVRRRMEETPEIWADTGKLQVAFFHLVQNGEQAMMAAHGGGTLTIRVGPSSLGVRVEVADDGPGIPPEDLPRIFNPFFTTKAPGRGTRARPERRLQHRRRARWSTQRRQSPRRWRRLRDRPPESARRRPTPPFLRRSRTRSVSPSGAVAHSSRTRGTLGVAARASSRLSGVITSAHTLSRSAI